MLDEWTSEWLPDLGGRRFAEDAPGENRINGVRARPSKEDPHISMRVKKLFDAYLPDLFNPAAFLTSLTKGRGNSPVFGQCYTPDFCLIMHLPGELR